jgi:hypothetical protein
VNPPKRRRVIRRQEDVQARQRMISAFVALVLVVTLVVAALGWFAKENNERIHDIQVARVASCQRTYEGIREVFTPFMPKPPNATPDQLQDWSTFNSTIDELKENCTKQTRVSEQEARG